jgi:plastocyanin
VKPIVLTAALAGVFASVIVSVPVGARTPAGGSASATGDKRTTTVRVMDNFFDPRSTKIEQDGKVTFVWKGDNRHNVRFTKVPAGAKRQGSRTRRKGDWSRRFSKPGLYRYVCTLFAGMRGTITVKAPPSGEG